MSAYNALGKSIFTATVETKKAGHQVVICLTGGDTERLWKNWEQNMDFKTPRPLELNWIPDTKQREHLQEKDVFSSFIAHNTHLKHNGLHIFF